MTESTTQPGSSAKVTAAVPLAVAYVFMPVLLSLAAMRPEVPAGLARALGVARPGVPMVAEYWSGPAWFTLAWAVLAVFGLLWLGWKSVRSGFERSRSTLSSFRLGGLRLAEGVFVLASACLFTLAVRAWAVPRAPLAEAWLPWLAEAAPVVHLCFAALWCWSFGLPSARQFRIAGAALALLTLADALGAAIAAGPGAMPNGLALVMDRDALGCLVGVALLAGMREGRGPGPSLSGTDVILVLGLGATFSIMALFAVACAWLFLGRGGRISRMVVAAVLLGCMVFALLERLPLTADTVRLQGHLLWLGGMEYFMDHPEALLQVRGLGPFPLSMPAAIAAQLGLPARTELLHPDQVHSLWLRATLVWGGWGSGLLLAGLLLPATLRPTRFLSGLVALILAMGTVSGLFYAPETGVVLWLAAFAAVAAWRPAAQREGHGHDDEDDQEEEPWFAFEEEERS